MSFGAYYLGTITLSALGGYIVYWALTYEAGPYPVQADPEDYLGYGNDNLTFQAGLHAENRTSNVAVRPTAPGLATIKINGGLYHLDSDEGLAEVLKNVPAPVLG